MFIQGLLLIILAVVAGLITFLVGFVGWIILKLMKEELHLQITINNDDKETESPQE
jgi:hypothetical protein